MDFQQGLWWLSIGTECSALASLLLRRTARSYPWFASYLGFQVVLGIALHFAGPPNRSKTYAIAWMITEPIVLSLLVLTTTEIVGKIPSHYRGFGNFGRQKLRRLLDIAIAVALVSSVAEATGPQWNWSIGTLLRFMFGLHRITTSMLAVYLVLVAVFVSRVHVPFQRNLLMHSRLFACYLTLQTGVMLFAVAAGHGTARLDEALIGGSTVLFLLWTVLLTEAGERLPARKTLTEAEISTNEVRERKLQDAANRYSDRPLG